MNNMVFTKGLFSKTDMMFYAVSILVGALIVVGNYQLAATQEMVQRDGFRSDYMEQIISRMDMVSGQLSAWGSMDVNAVQAGLKHQA